MGRGRKSQLSRWRVPRLHSELAEILATVQHAKRKPLIENDEKLSNLFMLFVIKEVLVFIFIIATECRLKNRK